jgi:hypothetical protein
MINSSLCAALSGVNNSYKWFYNSKPCVDVILKYAQRGYSTICTTKEIAALKEYMKLDIRWKDFASSDIDMRGMVSRDHLFFNPCHYNAGLRYNLRVFKKPHTVLYSKCLYVGFPKCITEYNVDLTVKNNTKIIMPDLGKVNLFIEYMEQIKADEFSDSDSSDGNSL